jgi:hypothetical protein
MWQQVFYGIDQVWNWLVYEATVHPFLFAGTVIIVVSAWALYKAEVRTK